MGRVHSINTGKDGLVRSVQVRCAKEGKISKNLLDRPIHKLCVIVPVEEQQWYSWWPETDNNSANLKCFSEEAPWINFLH